MTTIQQRFTSLGQAAGFVCGQLNGLSGTTRFDLPDDLRSELKSISHLLSDEVKRFDELREKTQHSTK